MTRQLKSIDQIEYQNVLTCRVFLIIANFSAESFPPLKGIIHGVVPPQIHVEILTLSTSDCDLIWKQDHWRCK